MWFVDDIEMNVWINKYGDVAWIGQDTVQVRGDRIIWTEYLVDGCRCLELQHARLAKLS